MDAQVTKLSRKTLKLNAKACRLFSAYRKAKATAMISFICDTRMSEADILELHEYSINKPVFASSSDELAGLLNEARGLVEQRKHIIACLTLGGNYAKGVHWITYARPTYINRVAKEEGFAFRMPRHGLRIKRR